MKDALAEGKQLPTELRNDARKMGPDLKFDEAQASGSTFFGSGVGGVVGVGWGGRREKEGGKGAGWS